MSSSSSSLSSEKEPNDSTSEKKNSRKQRQRQKRDKEKEQIRQIVQSIQVFENTSLAVDDSCGYHAFQREPLLSSSSFLLLSGVVFMGKVCQICGLRLRNVPSFSSSSMSSSDNNDGEATTTTKGVGNEIVKCISCGIYVHRSCLMMHRRRHRLKKKGSKKMKNITFNNFTMKTLEQCKVNQPAIDSYLVEKDEPSTTSSTIEEEREEKENNKNNFSNIITTAVPPTFMFQSSASPELNDDDEEEEENSLVIDTRENNNTLLLDDEQSHDTENNIEIMNNQNNNNNDNNNDLVWTSTGPPTHWALNRDSNILHELSHDKQQRQQQQQQQQQETPAPIQFLNESISSVSKILQDNLFAFSTRTEDEKEREKQEKENNNNNNDKEEIVQANVSVVKENTNDDDDDDDADDGPLIPLVVPPEETNIFTAHAPPLTPSLVWDKVNKISKSTSFTIPSSSSTATSITRKTRPSSITAASVAGGIAGGVAGLCLAGPAGMYLGLRVGQTVGVLSILAEGSIHAGVLAVSLCAAGYSVHQKHTLGKKFLNQTHVKMLAIGEEGMAKKLMLVRPYIVLNDQEWENTCEKLKQEWIDSCLLLKEKQQNNKKNKSCDNSNDNGKDKKEELAIHQKQRIHDLHEKQKKERDKVITDENDDIDLKDKILLLVSRSLNDKTSLPGFMYRNLIKQFRARIKNNVNNNNNRMNNDDDDDRHHKTSNTEKDQVQVGVKEEDKGNINSDDKDVQPDEFTNSSLTTLTNRDLRQNAHGIIKYVTATLLFERPGLSSSPILTEMSANAVESLVFGQIYSDVFEEIVQETKEKDEQLRLKINDFFLKKHHNNNEQVVRMVDSKYISQEALNSLKSVTEAHSTMDKLGHCVSFLEHISEITSSSSSSSSSLELGGADILLKLVCQHLIFFSSEDIIINNNNNNNKINAEALFMEEFARDEQLLRGKFGYALVTIQAALHFLNSSQDFYKDIFCDDDDDDNDDK